MRKAISTQSCQPWVQADFRRRAGGWIFPLITALVLLAGAVITMTGCSAGDAPSNRSAVALVIDKGQTSRLAEGSDECVSQVFEPIVADGGYMVIDLASSEPQIVCSMEVTPAGNTSPNALESRWNRDRLFEDARAVSAKHPESEEMDLLKAIGQAADELRWSAPDATDYTLYVASSGIQTCGDVNLTNNGPYGDILSWDYDKLLATIADSSSSGAITAEALPDLSGIHVVWMGCGDLTAGDQESLTAPQVAKLKDLWSRVLLASGATFDSENDFVNCPVHVPEEDEGGFDYDSLPHVTPVTFEDTPGIKPVSFDENVLAFVEDSASYRDDPDHVRQTLEPYAASIAATGTDVVILGTTAKVNGVDAAASRDLGFRRATHVKDDFVRYGVDPDQITVCSAGFEGVGVHIGDQVVDFYKENYDADGNWNEEVARTNRAIHLIPKNIAGEVMERFSV